MRTRTKKMLDTMIKKHGSRENYIKYMKKIAAAGGKGSNNGGFAAATREQRIEWGRRGGTISKRTPKS